MYCITCPLTCNIDLKYKYVRRKLGVIRLRHGISLWSYSLFVWNMLVDTNYLVSVQAWTMINGWKRWMTSLRITHNGVFSSYIAFYSIYSKDSEYYHDYLTFIWFISSHPVDIVWQFKSVYINVRSYVDYDWVIDKYYWNIALKWKSLVSWV